MFPLAGDKGDTYNGHAGRCQRLGVISMICHVFNAKRTTVMTGGPRGSTSVDMIRMGTVEALSLDKAMDAAKKKFPKLHNDICVQIDGWKPVQETE